MKSCIRKVVPKKMTTKKDVIVIPFALDWNNVSHCEHQTAISLAKRGFKVIAYMHKGAHFFLKKPKCDYPKINNILFYVPVYPLPFKRFLFIERINQFLNLKYLKRKFIGMNSCVLWIFNYIFASFTKMFDSNSINIYDCVEFPSSFDKAINSRMRDEEKILINNASYFFVDSPTLSQKWHRYKPILTPQGYMPLNSKLSEQFDPIINKLSKDKPIIAYVGGINYRLDFPLIYKLIKNNQYWEFLFVGNTQFFPSEDKYTSTDYWLEKLSKLKNFHHISELGKTELSRVLNRCSVCLIPYNTKIKFNYFSRAMKIYDYFILNKPIISTPILESLRLKDIVAIADSPSEFAKKIQEYLDKPLSERIVDKQRLLCVENTWDKKIDYILKTIYSS